MEIYDLIEEWKKELTVWLFGAESDFEVRGGQQEDGESLPKLGLPE